MFIEEMSKEDIDDIQELIDYDDKIIKRGIWICGKNLSLDKGHISRIRTATQKIVDKIKAKYL